MTTPETPIRRALLVIDVQNEYVTGAMHIDAPPITDSLAQIGRAIDSANQLGIPVIQVQHSAPEQSPIFARGSASWQLHDSVAKRPYQHLIEKQFASAFTGTELQTILEQAQINTLTVIGYMTHNCVAATIYEASHRGYTVEFLADAAGSLPYRNEAGSVDGATIHQTYSVVFQSAFAAVTTAEAWINAITTGKPLSRSNVFVSHQQALSRKN